MRWSRRHWLAGLSTTALSGCAGAREHQPPKTPRGVEVLLPRISREPIAGGGTLYLVPDEGVPLVALAVTLRAGHGQEPPGQEGLARLVASMLLEGMEEGDRRGLLDRYGELGTTPAAWAMPRRLMLRCTVHRDDAPAALRLMLDNLRRPTLSPEAFERLRRQQQGSLASAEGDPNAVTGLGLMLGTQGVEPPAALLSLGTAGSVGALQLDDVRSWLAHRRHRAGLTVAMAGDVDEASAHAWIREASLDWSAGGESTESPSQEQPVEHAGPRTVLVPWPGLSQAVVGLGTPVKALGDRGEPAQTLASSLLAGIVSRELRTRLRTSYGVESETWRTKLGEVGGHWAKVDPADVGRAVQRILEFLQRIEGEVKFRADVVQELRQGAMIDQMNDFHGAEPSLAQLLRLAEDDLAPQTYRSRLEVLRQVDAPQVTGAFLRAHHPERLRVCILGDPAAVQRAQAVLPADGVVVRSPAQLMGRQPASLAG